MLSLLDREMARRRAFFLTRSSNVNDRLEGIERLWTLWEEPTSSWPGGVQANWFSESAALSADGRFVAFESRASNLATGDTNGSTD